jgi:hypothetical protein
MGSLLARAGAAGLTRAALTEARKELLIAAEKDRDGPRRFRRSSGASPTALDDATAWLERELPAGATELRETLHEQGEAAGHSREALNLARKRLSVTKLHDAREQAVWSRPARSH